MSKETLPRTRESLREETRPKRVPLHDQKRSILTAPKRSGYVRRWVNDVLDRIPRFQQAGWTVVEENVQVGDKGVESNNTSLGGGARRHVGQDIHAVLMEIPQEIYDEDQRTKQQTITERELAMKQKLNSGDDGTYGEVTFGATKPSK